MPFGDAVDLFKREGREDQVGKLRLPSERFSFVKRQSENARVPFQQQIKIAIELRPDCREGGAGGL